MSFSQPNCKELLGGGFVRWHDTKQKSGVTLTAYLYHQSLDFQYQKQNVLL
jgi:hypothetical protein